MSTKANIVVCTYHVRPGQEDAFEGLLKNHLPTLVRLGLTNNQPAMSLKSVDEERRSTYVQIFEWANAEAAERAHEVPAVIAIWEPMATMCELRNGRPAMDFPHFETLDDLENIE